MNDKERAVMQQALDTSLRVEQDSEECEGEDGMVMVVPLDAYNDMMASINAMREALAEQAEREPVAVVEDWPTDKTPKGIVALGDIKELPAGTLLYASPAISTEVFTREKVDSLLIAAYTKGRNDLLEKQAEQEPPVDSLMVDVSALLGPFVEDGKPIRVKDARDILRRVRKRRFTAEPAPVRTKDLTDVEVEKVWRKHGGYMVMPIDFARAIIAADREKNRA